MIVLDEQVQLWRTFSVRRPAVCFSGDDISGRGVLLARDATEHTTVYRTTSCNLGLSSVSSENRGVSVEELSPKSREVSPQLAFPTSMHTPHVEEAGFLLQP